MSWTSERIEELKQLWEAGHSASEIGKKLGVSKNAVVGKAHRLKLAARPSPIKRGGGPARRRPAAAQRQAAARAATASPITGTPAAGGGPAEVAAGAGKTGGAQPRLSPGGAANGTPANSGAANSGAANGARSAGGLAGGSGKAVSRSPFAAAEMARRPRQARTTRSAGGSQSCAWPIGDPGDAGFHFCGEPTVPGKPYCQTHCAQAYISKKKEEAA